MSSIAALRYSPIHNVRCAPAFRVGRSGFAHTRMTSLHGLSRKRGLNFADFTIVVLKEVTYDVLLVLRRGCH